MSYGVYLFDFVSFWFLLILMLFLLLVLGVDVEWGWCFFEVDLEVWLEVVIEDIDSEIGFIIL